MNVFFSNRKAKDESQSLTLEKKEPFLILFSCVGIKWKKKNIENRLDYRTDFRDVSRLFVPFISQPLHAKYVIFVSAVFIDNIFSIFDERTNALTFPNTIRCKRKKSAPHSLSRSHFHRIIMYFCVCEVRTARCSAFHASSFPKSLIFRMVFVLENVKFMLLLATRKWLERTKKKATTREIKK